MIRRCRSLNILAAVARRFPGGVGVEIRGRPSLSEIPDFHRIVAEAPGLSFQGPCDRRQDLAAMHGRVPSTWAIDYYEAGANSDWLLPNRLYGGSPHRSVSLALRRVETGRWLARNGAGLLPNDETEDNLLKALQAMSPDRYAAAVAAVAAIARADLMEDGSDGLRLAGACLR